MGGLDPTVESIGVVSERYHEAAEAVNKTFDADRPIRVSWGQKVGPAMLDTPWAVAPPEETGDAVALYYSQTRSRQEAGLFDVCRA